MRPCEWNPVLHEEALASPSERGTDCKNEALWVIGRDGIFLCTSCSQLPEFDKFTSRNLIKGRRD